MFAFFKFKNDFDQIAPYLNEMKQFLFRLKLEKKGHWYCPIMVSIFKTIKTVKE